jgi:hypothetical protein
MTDVAATEAPADLLPSVPPPPEVAEIETAPEAFTPEVPVRGRIVRTLPGHYVIAPSPPPEQPNVRDDGHTEEEWFAALEAYLVDSSTWDTEKLGPPLGRATNRIPQAIS